MPPKKILITGMPGSGKTTLCKKIVNLMQRSYKVGGFFSGEIRNKGVRKGFKIIDIATRKEGILAHVDQKTGPRVGRYRVNLEDLNNMGVNAIRESLDNCDVSIIDEIGPMELFSRDFVKVVKDAFSSDRRVIATIHFYTKDKLIRRFGLEGVPVFVVDRENQAKRLKEVIKIIEDP